MNNKGQMAVTEGIVIIVLIGLCVFLGYQLIKKPSDVSIFQKDSKPNIHDVKPSTSPLSCTNTKVEEFYGYDKVLSTALSNSVK